MIIKGQRCDETFIPFRSSVKEIKVKAKDRHETLQRSLKQLLSAPPSLQARSRTSPLLLPRFYHPFTHLPYSRATLLRAAIPLPGPLLSFAAPFSRPIISTLSPIGRPPPRETRSVPLSRFLYYTPWTVARQPPFLPSTLGAVVGATVTISRGAGALSRQRVPPASRFVVRRAIGTVRLLSAAALHRRPRGASFGFARDYPGCPNSKSFGHTTLPSPAADSSSESRQLVRQSALTLRLPRLDTQKWFVTPSFDFV